MNRTVLELELRRIEGSNATLQRLVQPRDRACSDRV